MNIRLALLLWWLNYSSGQDANCDFYQNVSAGQSYYVYSPNYPGNYSAGAQCRWIANCPQGYNCRLDCPEIRLPQSQSCSMDRLLVSRTGDPQLAGAETYCGLGSLSVVSTGQRIGWGLISSQNSPGGRFYCQLTAQRAAPNPVQCRCGERRQNRIVGGKETGINEYKMMAGIVDSRIVQIKCGAVIISKRHVLTAAHCVVDGSVDYLAVIVGEHNVSIGDSPATRAYRIANFTIHHQFTTFTYDYDIAIVTTTIPMEFSDLVGPVCLPFKFVNYSFAGDNVTILGWGTQFPGGPTSNVLMKVDVKVISQDACRNSVSSVTPRQLCTYTPGKDACQDDSGGPLLYTDPATGLLFSMGIVSMGKFCASESPGVNTRVTALLDWVTANTFTNYCVK